jgi:hypothetical protein
MFAKLERFTANFEPINQAHAYYLEMKEKNIEPGSLSRFFMMLE